MLGQHPKLRLAISPLLWSLEVLLGNPARKTSVLLIMRETRHSRSGGDHRPGCLHAMRLLVPPSRGRRVPGHAKTGCICVTQHELRPCKATLRRELEPMGGCLLILGTTSSPVCVHDAHVELRDWIIRTSLVFMEVAIGGLTARIMEGHNPSTTNAAAHEHSVLYVVLEEYDIASMLAQEVLAVRNCAHVEAIFEVR